MKLLSFGACSALVFSSFIASTARAAPQIQNFETQGNLESNYTLDCINIADAQSKYNPVDLYKAAAKCIEGGNYDKAAPLISLAGVYGRFDAYRVSDATAHQAVIVARMNILDSLPEEQKKKFSETAKGYLDDPKYTANLCANIQRIGPPTYFPRYMIQHGMSAFFGGNGNGLVADFDSKSAWRNALQSYLHCTVA